MSTIRDVAKRAGVSIATVSRVLSQSSHKVSGEARTRIVEAVKELDYRPNALAQGLIMRRSMTIGTIIPDISNSYYAEIVRGIQDVAEELGYAVVLQNTDRSKRRIIRSIQVLREKRADGIIFSGGVIHTYEILASLKELAGRVVVIGRHDVDFPSVQVDNLGGATQAVQHLVDLGHERIGFISGPRMSTSSIDRLKGYKNALARNERRYEAKQVRQGSLTPQSGFEAAKEILGEKERVSAIIASNDLMAFGAIRAARSVGLRVPQDLAVIGFDNIPLSSYFDPPLSTVEIPMYHLGAASMKMLADLLCGAEFSRIRLFPTRLLVRESSSKRGR